MLEPTDFIKRYGTAIDIQYEDLESIMKQNAISEMTKKRQQVAINYCDFSRWFGPTIQKAEGFYFRHDSKKNPHYSGWLIENEKKKGMDKRAAAESLWNENTVLDKIIEKICTYWKRTTKCFRDFNENNDESIEKDELRYYLQAWGFSLKDDQLDRVFKFFDHDGDEKITFQDFVYSVGYEIYPKETLYFRQDKQLDFVEPKCMHSGCWNIIKGQTNYCLVHLKMYRAKVESLFNKLYHRFKNNGQWNSFIQKLKRAADGDDHFSILYDRFDKLLQRFKIKLRPE